MIIVSYDQRVLIGEIYLPLDRLVTYYGENLSGAAAPFNFGLVQAAWNAKTIADLIRDYEKILPAGGWPNWVLGNHDQPRDCRTDRCRTSTDCGDTVAYLTWHTHDVLWRRTWHRTRRDTARCLRRIHRRNGAWTWAQSLSNPHAMGCLSSCRFFDSCTLATSGRTLPGPQCRLLEQKTSQSLLSLYRRLIGLRRAILDSPGGIGNCPRRSQQCLDL